MPGTTTKLSTLFHVLVLHVKYYSYKNNTHAHHVPHAEHVERSDEMVKRSRDYVEDFEDVSGTPCCPPPVLFTAQRAKLSRVFNGQNYL